MTSSFASCIYFDELRLLLLKGALLQTDSYVRVPRLRCMVAGRAAEPLCSMLHPCVDLWPSQFTASADVLVTPKLPRDGWPCECTQNRCTVPVC